jgi:hypothetical protein
MIELTKKSLKLIAVCENEGFRTIEDLLKATGLDCVSPGICMNEGCNYVTEVEPDQREGYCEQCDDCSVTSALILAGVL